MAIERRIFKRNALLGHVGFQASAHRSRGLASPGDTHREMPAARKHPDIAFEFRDELDIDTLARARNKITQRGNAVTGAPLRTDLAQGIARTRRHHQETASAVPLRVRSRQPFSFCSIASTRSLLPSRPRQLRAFQQHPVEVQARVDHQRLGQVHLGFAGASPESSPPFRG